MAQPCLVQKGLSPQFPWLSRQRQNKFAGNVTQALQDGEHTDEFASVREKSACSASIREAEAGGSWDSSQSGLLHSNFQASLSWIMRECLNKETKNNR